MKEILIETGSCLVAAMLLAQILQLAEPAHVALAPRGDAVAQPVLLALDRLAQLVLLQFLCR